MMASRYVLGRRFVPDHAAAASAALKLESMLPGTIRDYCGSILEHTEVRPPPASDDSSIAEALPTLQYAALHKRKVEVRYDSYYERRAIETTFHPYRVVYVNRGWYVLAFSEQHGQVRTFKVERILQMRMTEHRFRRQNGFDVDEYFGNAWMMIRGDERHHVAIRFTPKVAANVDEIRWHKTQRTRFEDDGSLIFEVDVDGIGEIAWWVLGYGAEAEVIEPEALRCKVLAHAQQLVERYGVVTAPVSKGRIESQTGMPAVRD